MCVCGAPMVRLTPDADAVAAAERMTVVPLVTLAMKAPLGMVALVTVVVELVTPSTTVREAVVTTSPRHPNSGHPMASSNTGPPIVNSVCLRVGISP